MCIVRLSPIGGMFYNLFEALQGSFRVILAYQQDPHIKQGEHIVRVQGEGLAALLYSLVPPPLLAVDNPHAGIRRNRSVFSLQEGASHLLGFMPTPGLDESVEQRQAGGAICRIGLHSLLQACQFCVIHAFPFMRSHMCISP